MVSTNDSASVKGRAKRARSVDRGSAAIASKSSATTSPSSSARTTQLSGVTRNMRFMQRGKNNNTINKARHSFPQAKQKNNSDDNTESNTAVNNVKEAIEVSTRYENVAGQKIEVTLNHEDNYDNATTEADVKLEKATPLEMYGQNQWLVLGRRSFNGFNPITASNWYMQQQYLDREDKRLNRTAIATNERRRYEELTKLVHNEDRNESSNNRGKREGKRGISNQKKRGLDDILKLVDQL